MFLFLFFAALISSSLGSDVINKRVERAIDISSQLVEINAKITLQNAGKTPVSSFIYALEPETKDNLAYISAFFFEDDIKTYLKVEQTVNPAHKEKSLYKVELSKPLSAGKDVTVEVQTVFTHYLVPHPSHITQSEKQLVIYSGNHYFYTPYATKSQATTITLPSNSVESYSKNVKPVSHSDNLLNYGPYDNISPFTLSKLTVHCENNNPFLTVTQLHRSIEVSHWGVISIEEIIDVTHSGAVLKGPFSRYEFQRDQSGISSVKSFKTVLPASASDVYYRDEIGNISTSHLRELDDSVEVELRPRFPLFGGWKTHYTLGYYVPTYEYLYNSGDNYVLKIRFVDHIFDDSVIDDAEVKVILPEGSMNIQVKLPYSAARGPDTLHCTYLDTVGRPVVTLYKSNLVEQHIQDFEVHYEYQKLLMLQEPLLVVIALYLLFIVVIIYVRQDFSLTKNAASEAKLRVAGYIEMIQNHHDKRADIYASYDEALNKFKTHKDVSAYQLTVKRLNNEHKAESQAISEMLAKLKADGSEAAEKVAELQRYDKTLKELLQQQTVLIEKLITNKMNKQQYLDSENQILRKKEDIVEKMQSCLLTL